MIVVHRPPPGLLRNGLVAVALALAIVNATLALVVVGPRWSAAMLDAAAPVDAQLSAARIFRDERVTPAFSVNDASSGTAVDRSSATAFGNDGLYFLTRAWPVAFDAARYLDLDLSSPLPAGLATQNVSLALRFSSDAGTGSVCIYVEIRRASTDALLSSHGSSGSPLACTSGTAVTTLNVSLAAVIDTDTANDLRVRLYADDSAAGSIRVDEATVSGDASYASFTLYPILTREQFNGQQELLRWGLAGS
jgi:hypothetical protein